MKLKSSTIFSLTFPLVRAIRTNKGTINTVDCLALELKTTTGENIGKSFIRITSSASSLAVKKTIKEILFALAQQNAIENQSKWDQFWHSYRKNRMKEEIYALAAIDIAVWDLFLKTNKRRLYQLSNLHGNQKIPLYGTTGWLSLSEDELIEECKKYKKLGINGFKIRLGHSHDYERVKAVRYEMGDDYRLMLDANQQYSVEEALQVAKKMVGLNICWFEEPVGNDIKDSISISQISPIPIALGENIFTEEDFSNTCRMSAAQILQPDIIRCGGVTGFLKIAKTVAQYKIPICNHLMPELSFSLLSNFTNSFYLEYDDILPMNIFTQCFSIKDGFLTPPKTYGTGVELTNDAIRTFTTSKEEINV